MTISVKIGSAEQDGVTDAELARKPGIKVRLDIRKTLDGNLIIADHPDIDIIVLPKNNKILAIAKELNSGVYGMYAGDLNGDNIVNNQDYNYYQLNQGANIGYSRADIDGDGNSNSQDYDLWFKNRSKIGKL